MVTRTILGRPETLTALAGDGRARCLVGARVTLRPPTHDMDTPHAEEAMLVALASASSLEPARKRLLGFLSTFLPACTVSASSAGWGGRDTSLRAIVLAGAGALQAAAMTSSLQRPHERPVHVRGRRDRRWTEETTHDSVEVAVEPAERRRRILASALMTAAAEPAGRAILVAAIETVSACALCALRSVAWAAGEWRMPPAGDLNALTAAFGAADGASSETLKVIRGSDFGVDALLCAPVPADAVHLKGTIDALIGFDGSGAGVR